MVSRYEQFAGAIFGIYRDIQRIERDEMEKFGLRGAYAQYLLAIGRHPEGVTSAELREICDKDKAAISRVVAEMQLKGLVHRRRVGENLYRARLTLTERGRQAAQMVSARAERAVELADKGLTEEDRKLFYSVLEKIADNLQRITKDGIPG